jgi:hypothetical protein
VIQNPQIISGATLTRHNIYDIDDDDDGDDDVDDDDAEDDYELSLIILMALISLEAIPTMGTQNGTENVYV